MPPERLFSFFPSTVSLTCGGAEWQERSSPSPAPPPHRWLRVQAPGGAPPFSCRPGQVTNNFSNTVAEPGSAVTLSHPSHTKVFIYRITDILYRGSLPSSIVLCPDDDLSMDGTSSIPCFPLRCLVGFPWPWMHPIGTRAWSFPGTGLVRPKPNRARHCHVFVRSVLPSCRHGSYAPLNPKATVATSSRSTRIRTAVRPDACVCCDASGESRGDRGGASVRVTRPGAHHGRVAIAIGNTLHA